MEINAHVKSVHEYFDTRIAQADQKLALHGITQDSMQRKEQLRDEDLLADHGQQGAEKTEADDETTGQGRDDDTEQIDAKDVGKTRDRD